MDENRLIAKEDEMDDSELSVKRFFEHGRFEITRVSRPKARAHNQNDSSPKLHSDYFPKHCDFSVTYNAEKYLVEVKTREENEDTEKALKQGNIVTEELTTGRTQSIQGIVKSSIKQMDSIENEPTETYKVLWIVLHVDEHLSFEQIRSTIYGCTKIYTEKKGDETGRTYECFYFSHSMFHRYQQLDAVVIQTRTGWHLCVNNYANRYFQFKQCRLYTLLKDGVIDPGIDDFFQEYACLVADCSIDRCQTEDVLEHVKKTYQVDFARNFDWNVLRGAFAQYDT